MVKAHVPKLQSLHGRKDLNKRIHHCGECGYKTDRDVAAAQVVMQRGLAAVGHTGVLHAWR